MRSFSIVNLSFRTQLLIVMLVLSTIFYLFNLFSYKYQASSYVDFNSMLIVFPGYLLYWFSRNIRDSHPQLSFLLNAAWVITIASLVINFFTMTIQYTPFQLYDTTLLKWDQFLHFNSIAVVNWFYQFPMVPKLLDKAYSSMIEETLFAPIILAILQQQRRFDVFVNVCLISAIIGYLIYYFFPTAGPCTVLQNPHFSHNMCSVALRFYDVQHHIPNDDILGGIIALPSFHVIWALIVLYSFKNYKLIFYPLLIWNSLVLLSTLALGWHYLVDVLASIVLVIIAIIIAEKNAIFFDYPFREVWQGYKRELSRTHVSQSRE